MIEVEHHDREDGPRCRPADLRCKERVERTAIGDPGQGVLLCHLAETTPVAIDPAMLDDHGVVDVHQCRRDVVDDEGLTDHHDGPVGSAAGRDAEVARQVVFVWEGAPGARRPGRPHALEPRPERVGLTLADERGERLTDRVAERQPDECRIGRHDDRCRIRHGADEGISRPDDRAEVDTIQPGNAGGHDAGGADPNRSRRRVEAAPASASRASAPIPSATLSSSPYARPPTMTKGGWFQAPDRRDRGRRAVEVGRQPGREPDDVGPGLVDESLQLRRRRQARPGTTHPTHRPPGSRRPCAVRHHEAHRPCRRAPPVVRSRAAGPGSAPPLPSPRTRSRSQGAPGPR